MSISVRDELRQMRNLSKRGVSSDLVDKYKFIFTQLPPLEQKVMEECYIRGKSYASCGYKLAYCERQIKRIVQRSTKRIDEILNDREL